MPFANLGEEPAHLHCAAACMGCVDGVKGANDARYLAVLNRIARHRTRGRVELPCLLDRNDGVLLTMNEEEGWRVLVDARKGRGHSVDVRMTRLRRAWRQIAPAPHVEQLSGVIAVPEGTAVQTPSPLRAGARTSGGTRPPPADLPGASSKRSQIFR